MGTVTRSHTFTSGEVLTAANLNGEINGILTAVNGNIDANNVDTSAIPTLTATQTLTNKTLTAPKIGTSILDTNGNELFLLTATGSAVNEFTLANAATSGSPTLSATGGDSNIDITLTPKGTGQVVITSDLKMGTNTSGHILVADGTNFKPVAVSNDVTIASNGAVTIASGAVEYAMIASAAIKDEDNMASDSATHLATQQSIKKYVDDRILTEDTIAELNDTTITSATSGNVLIYDGSDSWDNKAISNHATLANDGQLTISNDVITNAMMADDAIDTPQIADDAITSALIDDNAVGTAAIASSTTLTTPTLTSPVINVTGDADGDIYYRASGAFARLAKGTAGQVLKINDGATAPEWGNSSAVSNLTTSNFAGATLVTASEGIGLNNNETTIPTSAAVKAYSDAISGVSASSPSFTADMTIFDDQNDANPKISLGTSSAECANIQVVNRSGGKLVDYLLIETVEASSDADEGKIIFKVDGTQIVEFDDGAVNIASGKALEINGTSVLNATTLGSGVVTSSLTTVGNLNSGSITSGFTSINVGAGTIDTTGAVSTGDLSVSGGSSTGVVISSGDISIKNAGDNSAKSAIKFYCESSNAHYVKLEAPAHADSGWGGASNKTLSLPAATDTLIGRATTDTLTNKTWNGAVIASAYLDADTAHLSGSTFTGAVTTGSNTSGVDVKFFGTSDGAYLEWDTSADQLRIMGASADATTSTGKLLLATSNPTINANDVLGKIDFQAPHETGADAITVSASIQAIAQDTFSASVNATDLIFYTGHSEAATEKFRITSQGELGIGGANYGSDGQVLTSTGAGSAPAWESASGAYNSWTIQSDSYTASSGDQVITTKATANTVTLPSSPSEGNTVTIKVAGAGIVTVARNSSKINSQTEDGTMFEGSSVQLVYVNATIGWISI